MSVSIVMSYYNRKSLLLNTLKTIQKSKYHKSVELVIVDDASSLENDISDIINLFDLNIKLIKIKKEDKWWSNPSIPYNIGFKNATYDNIIIQNPECLHVGDIIDVVINRLEQNIYLNFACYSVDKKTNDIFLKDELYTDNWVDNIKNSIKFNDRKVMYDGDNGWYSHIKYRPIFLHFCSAIKKDDLNKIGVFNEEFAHGIGYEDNEFLYRVYKNLEIRPIIEPFVIHQYHTPTDYKNNTQNVMLNLNIFKKLTNIK